MASRDDGMQGVRTTARVGELVRETRKEQGLTQLDLAGLAGLSNRFIIDLEHGKETLQMQKALDVLALLGLELVIRRKS